MQQDLSQLGGSGVDFGQVLLQKQLNACLKLSIQVVWQPVCCIYCSVAYYYYYYCIEIYN